MRAAGRVGRRADGEAVARLASGWIGTPYVHQASARGHGTDCLGLVRGVYRELHGAEPMPVPPYSPAWHGEGEPMLTAARTALIETDAARVGDVLVFRMTPGASARHCGVLIAPYRFVHAYSGRAVTPARFGRYWRARVAGVFSFPEVP